MPPKKLTDEELKKYGIHVASRLNEEDAQGQNKWADIDDDDEDWAPEAITWGDGTKTTLPQLEENPSPPPLSNGAAPDKPINLEKPSHTELPKTGPSITSKPVGLPSGKGLVLNNRSNQEKPTTTAKPPQLQQPAKSPWATLPPVDKSSPVVIDSAHNLRDVQRDPPSGRNAVQAPKEIAADDFSRSTWRESSTHSNKELFNSQSGRYEPAPERRGSVHGTGRHPAVLHRPSATEPITDTPQPTQGIYEATVGRRRGSSNASIGNGAVTQRKGYEGSGSGPDQHSLRRQSFNSPSGSPTSPSHGASQSQTQQKQHPSQPAWTSRTNHGLTNSGGYVAPTAGDMSSSQTPGQDHIDELEYQKKVMRERIDMARKRRQEEEAREAIAKKERIQKKLDALGPAPDKDNEKKSVLTDIEASRPTQIQQREQTATTETLVTNSTEERPKSADKEPVTRSETATNVTVDPSINDKSQTGKGSGTDARRLSQSQNQDGKRPNLWVGSGQKPDRYQSWGTAGPPPSRGVWGSPDNDKGLGNGTFDLDLGRIPGAAVTATPTPTGSSLITTSAGKRAVSQTTSLSTSQPPPPIGSRAARYAAASAGNDLGKRWVAGVAESDKQLSAAQFHEFEERERRLAESGKTLDEAQPVINDTWRPVLSKDGSRQGIEGHEVPRHRAEAWKTPRELPPGPSAQDEPMTKPGTGLMNNASGSVLSNQAGQAPATQSRPSRFFPSRDHQANSPNHTIPGRPGSPSPPPPTMGDHPAYEGDITRPHVSLPRPQPIVKLPPAVVASIPQVVESSTNFSWATPQPFKEAKGSQAKWQDRINTLLNVGKSPPKLPSINPVSKKALDLNLHQDLATVSLPGSPLIKPEASQSCTSHQYPPSTKPPAEECFEEQEMGSLPQIRFPRNAPEAAWQPATVPLKPLPRKFVIQPTAAAPFIFLADLYDNGNNLNIQLPGMSQAKHVKAPPSLLRGGRAGQIRGNPRQRGSGRGKRESSETPVEPITMAPTRGGRGNYRGRGSWARHTAAATSLQV